MEGRVTPADMGATTQRGFGGRRLALALVVGALVSACSHELTVRNLGMYSTPMRLMSGDTKPAIGVLPFSGTPDEIFYFNSIVEKLSASPAVGEVRTDYIASRSGTGRFAPDLLLSIQPTVQYRSSGWNFLVNWPGFLIFTPAWNGYVYYADILTQIAISDADGKPLGTASIPVSYSIRQAEMDRTIFTGLTWLEVSLLAFGGGIYNANVFDRDIIGGLQSRVKDNYSTFVLNQMTPKVVAAADEVDATRNLATPTAEPTLDEAIEDPSTQPQLGGVP